MSTGYEGIFEGFHRKEINLGQGRRMSTLSYNLAIKMVAYRDNPDDPSHPACSLCGRRVGDPTTEAERRRGQPDNIERLELDHIDGNCHNNDDDNLRLLCVTCNLCTDRRCRQCPLARAGGGVEEIREGEGGGERDEAGAGRGKREKVRKKDREGARVVKKVAEEEKKRMRQEGNVSTRLAHQLVDYWSSDSTPMKANSIFEVPYRRWVLGQVARRGSISKDDAIAGGAEFVGCSIQSTARYLKKLLGPEGPLTEVQGPHGEMQVVWKERYRPGK